MKNEEQNQNLFCMKQFKPAIVAIVVLAALVVGWTAYLEADTPRRLRRMAQNPNILRTATAPPIRFGAKAPHPDWGACDSCHTVFKASGRPPARRVAALTQVATAPPIQSGAKAPHPNWGRCDNCHTVTGAAGQPPTRNAAAIMQVATAPPIQSGAKPPHPDWGSCTTCHNVIKGGGAAKTAAFVQAATVAPPLGVWLRPITPATADKLGLENTDGVLVTGIQASSSASRADVQVGDVIQRIDNRKVETINDALIMIAAKTTGDTLKLQVLRNGRIKKVFIGITETPPLQTRAVPVAATTPPSNKIAIAATGLDLGAQVAPIFSSAPAFILYDASTGRFSVVSNAGIGQVNAGQQATAQLMGMGVRAVITGNIGPSSLSRLNAAGIEVYSGTFGSVEKVIGQYQSGGLVATRNSVISGANPAMGGGNVATVGKIAVAATGASLRDQVADDLGLAPYLIFYDLKNGQTEVVVKDPAPDQGNNAVMTAQLIVERGASAVIAGNISSFSVKNLNELGVFSFAGVSASVGQAIQMYREGSLQVTTVDRLQPNRPALAQGQGVALTL